MSLCFFLAYIDGIPITAVIFTRTWATGDFVDPPYDWMTTDTSTQRLKERMADNDLINGEGVIALEHELSFESVQAFMDSYPHIEKNKWKSGAVPDLMQLPWYQN